MILFCETWGIRKHLQDQAKYYAERVLRSSIPQIVVSLFNNSSSPNARSIILSILRLLRNRGILLRHKHNRLHWPLLACFPTCLRKSLHGSNSFSLLRTTHNHTSDRQYHTSPRASQCKMVVEKSCHLHIHSKLDSLWFLIVHKGHRTKSNCLLDRTKHNHMSDHLYHTNHDRFRSIIEELPRDFWMA
jgi:hypothetical protein